MRKILLAALLATAQAAHAESCAAISSSPQYVREFSRLLARTMTRLELQPCPRDIEVRLDMVGDPILTCRRTPVALLNVVLPDGILWAIGDGLLQDRRYRLAGMSVLNGEISRTPTVKFENAYAFTPDETTGALRCANEAVQAAAALRPRVDGDAVRAAAFQIPW